MSEVIEMAKEAGMNCDQPNSYISLCRSEALMKIGEDVVFLLNCCLGSFDAPF